MDILADRLSDSVADWLRAHPGAQVICRDRAGSYAEGARVEAPEAIQVADRWHLFRNLSDAVERVARTHRRCLREQTEQPTVPPAAVSTSPAPPPRPRSRPTPRGAVASRVVGAQVTRQRHAEVQALLERGISLRAISGAVEGNVTRIKAIKRQMYGRANFDLLRRRMLLSH